MQLKVINSNSAGNAYILENDQEALLIECGVNFDKIKQALNFNLRKVVGCLVTHEHGDHAKDIDKVMSAGINVYATEGTFRSLNKSQNNRAVITFSGDQFRLGGFTVRPFKVEHDVAEPVGFLILHQECGKVLFLTDSFLCEWIFPGLNNIIIEANYSQDILDAKVAAGSNPKFLRDRVIQSHMSLETCKSMLAKHDLSQVNNIVLIHLSDGNSDEKRFKNEVEQLTGKQVHVAVAGLVIPFNKTPF